MPLVDAFAPHSPDRWSRVRYKRMLRWSLGRCSLPPRIQDSLGAGGGTIIVDVETADPVMVIVVGHEFP